MKRDGYRPDKLGSKIGCVGGALIGLLLIGFSIVKAMGDCAGDAYCIERKGDSSWLFYFSPPLAIATWFVIKTIIDRIRRR